MWWQEHWESAYLRQGPTPPVLLMSPVIKQSLDTDGDTDGDTELQQYLIINNNSLITTCKIGGIFKCKKDFSSFCFQVKLAKSLEPGEIHL